MAINIGINGFGRIGRLVFRSAINNDEFNVTCINDLLDINHLASVSYTHLTLPTTPYV